MTAYDYAHQQERRRQLARLAEAGGWECPMCNMVMLPGMPLDLDHSTPLVEGGRHSPRRLTHRACNRSAGGKLGRAIQTGTPVYTPSRNW